MIRITAGEFKGRELRTPSGQNTRPTQAKLRQALFNSIAMNIPGAAVLDLFAGSGALGFEALSRGADSLVCVEQSKSAIQIIRKNAEVLGVSEQVKVVAGFVERQLDVIQQLGPYDIVLADPPYGAGWEKNLMGDFPWDKILKVGGIFCFEWATIPKKVQELGASRFLVKTREKNYGDSVLTNFERETTEETSG